MKQFLIIILLASTGCGPSKAHPVVAPQVNDTPEENISSTKTTSLYDESSIPDAIANDVLSKLEFPLRTLAVSQSAANVKTISDNTSASVALQLEATKMPTAGKWQEIFNELADVTAEMGAVIEEINAHSDFKEPKNEEIHHQEINHVALNDRVQKQIEQLRVIKTQIAAAKDATRERR